MDIDFSGGNFWPAHNYRFGYVRGDVLRALAREPSVVSALLELLQPPGRPVVLRELKDSERRKLIVEELQHLHSTSTSPWKNVPLVEIFAAHIHAARSKAAACANAFSPVAKEEVLRAPIQAWLREQRLDVLDEMYLGVKKADLVGYRSPDSFLGEKVVAIELKNDLKQLDRGFAQLATYATYAHRTFLAATPDFLLQYLWQHVRSPNVRAWDSKALEAKLSAMNCGLLLVEGGSVTCILDATACEPTRERLREVRQAVAPARAGRTLAQQ